MPETMRVLGRAVKKAMLASVCVFVLSGCIDRADPSICNEEQRQEVSSIVAWCLEGLHSRDYCFDIAVEHVCHSTTGDHQ